MVTIERHWNNVNGVGILIVYHSDSANCSAKQVVEPENDKVNSCNFLSIDFCTFCFDFQIKFI
jgi:hypothetical protein